MRGLCAVPSLPTDLASADLGRPTTEVPPPIATSLPACREPSNATSTLFVLPTFAGDFVYARKLVRSIRMHVQAPMTLLAIVLSSTSEVGFLNRDEPHSPVAAGSGQGGWLGLRTLVFDLEQSGRRDKYNYQACKKLWALHRLQPYAHALILDSDFELTQHVPSVGFLVDSYKEVLYATPPLASHLKVLEAYNAMLGGTKLSVWPLDLPWVIDAAQLELFLAHLAAYYLPTTDRSLPSLVRFLLTPRAPEPHTLHGPHTLHAALCTPAHAARAPPVHSPWTVHR